jgi:hypothetical protein
MFRPTLIDILIGNLSNSCLSTKIDRIDTEYGQTKRKPQFRRQTAIMSFTYLVACVEGIIHESCDN